MQIFCPTLTSVSLHLWYYSAFPKLHIKAMGDDGFIVACLAVTRRAYLW